jgi:hypothetical protein
MPACYKFERVQPLHETEKRGMAAREESGEMLGRSRRLLAVEMEQLRG